MTACKRCGKPAGKKGENINFPYCSSDCGIAQYYDDKDRQVKAEYEEWVAKDPTTRGPWSPKTYID